MESELKLELDEGTLEKLHQLPLLDEITVGSPATLHLTNVYFDTPELDLHCAGIELRVRHGDGTRLQTLKAGASVAGGLHQREEWEMQVDGDRPNLKGFLERMGKGSSYATLLGQQRMQDRLQPVFTTNVTRTLRRIRLRTGDDVEVAIDKGAIEHEQAKEPICELELELKSGVPAHLYPFALELLEQIPMRIGTQSKAERGYAMRQSSQKTIVKATKLKLDPAMTVEEAFEAVIANCMAQVRGNEHGVTHGTDPESVHQMRVGLRRLRSALGLFRNAIECPAVLQEEWRWLASQLGSARDWEVLSDSTLKQLETLLPTDIDIGKLKAAALQQAATNRAEAGRAVTSLRHTRLQLQFAEWMASKGWRQSLVNPKASPVDLSLKKFSRQILEQAETRLLKRGKRFKDNEPESRHRARITAKKARYATEFFDSLFPKSRVKDYVASLSDLQQELGWLNDAAVAIELLGQLAITHRQHAADAAFVRGYLFASVHGDNEQLMRLWKEFNRTKPPYRH